MTSVLKQEGLVRSELKQHVEAVREAAGRAMGGILDTGRELIALKAACLHGEWAGAVAAAGVPERTAQRLMRAWREHEKHGTLANPPSVTALLEAAREVKPDSVSDLEMLDPRKLYEQIVVFEGFGKSVFADESITFGEQLAYACWMNRSEDSGLAASLSVHRIISAYATVLCAIDSDRVTEKEIEAVNGMHNAVLVGLQGFYKAAAGVMGDPRFKDCTFEEARRASNAA